jgi:sugar lactone lactonase YvrE
MRARVRILRQGFLVGVLAFGFAPKLAGQDTVVYATDFTNRRIWSVDITTGVNTLVTTTPVGPDSLIFAPNGNILYSARTPTGSLGSYDITAHTNTILVSGLGIPGDLALEPSMTSVLISDITGPRILRYVLGAGSYTVLASNLTIPGLIRVDGLTYDNSGKLFAALNGNSVAQIDPSNGTIIKQLGGLQCCLDGITFDPVTGDLWVSAYSSGGILRIPTNLSGSLGTFASSIPNPDGLESDGKGNIFVAATTPGNNVWEYNIASDTATKKNAVPGLDDVAPLTGLGAPPGYIEICKASDPNHPVTGLFTFTATPSFSGGPIRVPVGQCSGSIQVPSGAVTVAETPVLGVAVSNVTAYAYDELGFYHDELNSWTQPDLHAIVNVMVACPIFCTSSRVSVTQWVW